MGGAMLFQVGGQGARPTFFEMSAAQQLPASLRAALTYSLGVKTARLLALPLLVSDWIDRIAQVACLVLGDCLIVRVPVGMARGMVQLRGNALRCSILRTIK